MYVIANVYKSVVSNFEEVQKILYKSYSCKRIRTMYTVAKVYKSTVSNLEEVQKILCKSYHFKRIRTIYTVVKIYESMIANLEEVHQVLYKFYSFERAFTIKAIPNTTWLRLLSINIDQSFLCSVDKNTAECKSKRRTRCKKWTRQRKYTRIRISRRCNARLARCALSRSLSLARIRCLHRSKGIVKIIVHKDKLHTYLLSSTIKER